MKCHDFAGLRLLVDVLNEVALALNTSEGDLAAIVHSVNSLEEHILRVLVGRASVFSVQNAMKVVNELRIYLMIVALSALLDCSMLLLLLIRVRSEL